MTNETTFNKRKILVLGAGELGLEVLRELSAQGVAIGKADVSVMLRTSSSSSSSQRSQLLTELDALGVSVIAGDVVGDNLETIAETFAKFEVVVSCVGFAAGPGTQLKLALAAIESGIRKYYPWQFGVDYDVIGRGSAQPLFDEQLDVRDLLRSQSRIDWTIISTGMFTSFLFEPSFGVVDLESKTVNALGDWDTSVTVTTPQDIGKLTAKAVLSEPEITSKVIYTAGDTVSYRQLADLVDEALDCSVARNVWTIPFLQDELKKDPTNVLKRYRLVFAQGNDNGAGVAWKKEVSYNYMENVKVSTIADWLKSNAAV
ncbi:aromatic alcohol reductase [Pseudomonas putida]|uniref:aromatic alcohol reductase n=1 Tax=Pseudomonas putida TaxID=303 RepID=UPI000627FEC2|nr:aromatic alcohol reductase [Pseudomonas putida]KKO15732.1 2'-hydroxyisoflavone reductase [Pseudomonas putida KG-4]MDZ5110491.1 aromatic alcohol reductase [Pseudomonas putida]